MPDVRVEHEHGQLMRRECEMVVASPRKEGGRCLVDSTILACDLRVPDEGGHQGGHQGGHEGGHEGGHQGGHPGGHPGDH